MCALQIFANDMPSGVLIVEGLNIMPDNVLANQDEQF